MIGAILIGLLKANLAAGAGVLAVLAARRVVRTWFGARAAYALWLAPLAAAVAVLVPHPQLATPMSPMMLSAETAAADAVDALGVPAPARGRAGGPDVGGLLVAAWLAGALAAAALLYRRQARFTRAMGRLIPAGGPRVFRAESPDVGPAVVGVFRPRIVAPADFEARFAPAERDLILAHERAHLSGGDAAINALASALQCVAWFNPLVHVGVRTLRIDQELACDAAVIGRFPDARRAYAELLLKTQITTRPLPLGCHWPAGADHPLKERIAMLKSPLPRLSMRAAGLAVAGLASLGAGGLAWAAQPGPGAAERAAAEAFAALHPEYSCDPALEERGEGCKIVRTSMWLALPSHADILRAYPREALRAGISAEVRMTCAVTVEGLLKACSPVDTVVTAAKGGAADEALNAAFGQAAVDLSRYYQARIPKLPNPREGHTVMPVVFTPDATPGLRGDRSRPLPPLPTPAAAPQPRVQPVRTPVRYAAPAAGDPSAAAKAFAEEASPNWSRRPTLAELVAAYPAQAVTDRVEGDVVLHCRVATSGKLADCSVRRETPEGAGFGAAALKLSELFEAREQTPDNGPKRGGEINIPIRFRLPTGAAPSAN